MREKFQSPFMEYWATQNSCVSSVSGLKSGMTEGLSWKSRKQPIQTWKCLEPAFLEVFKSKPSNRHSWNTCLKILLNSVGNSELSSFAKVFRKHVNIPLDAGCWARQILHIINYCTLDNVYYKLYFTREWNLQKKSWWKAVSGGLSATLQVAPTFISI